ncbi:MAG: cyclic nucleotide-binding domain-containing protein [Rhizomicrobium sp.]
MTALALQTRPAASFPAAAVGRPPEAKSALAALGTIARFERNNTIFGEGDAADYSYKVVSGAVRLSKMMSDGRRQIAEFALPGDFFGINWLDEHALTAEALNDVTVICYGRGRLERLYDEIARSAPSCSRICATICGRRRTIWSSSAARARWSVLLRSWFSWWTATRTPAPRSSTFP